MNISTHPVQHSISSPSFSRHATLAMALSLAFFGLSGTLWAQVVSDNFNSGKDLGWTPYEGSPGTREVQFTTNSDGNIQYRIINHGSKDASGLFTRGASIRNDANYSSSFFVASEVDTWDDNMIGFAGPFIMAKLTPGQIAPGSTTGYLTTHFPGGPNGVQGLMGFIEFQTEVNITAPDLNSGGAVLTPKLDPTKGYRFVFKSGPGDLGGLLIAEMYDRYDLLEPFARAVARDDVNNGVHPSGVSGIGNFHVGEKDTADWTGTSDTTFDNFYASPNSNNFIGFVGVAQVVNLVPPPQTLFYAFPGTNQITFTASAFDTTQIATNTLKMFLNNADVSSQLSFTEVRDFLVGSPSTNFTVRFNGTLTPNTIYNGKIITLDTNGKGTTNTWVFDTFTTNGIITIEAEDYNYAGGQFQDNPPVSGLQPDGTQVNGNGPPGGYYSADAAGDLIATVAGQPDVDYHEVNTPDVRQDATRNIAGHQYRSADFVNTAQARMERGRDVRPQYVSANVGEYFVTGINAGEWMNYTRTFPSGSYNVYLRASSQKAQAVQLDEVTAGSTTSNQTTEVRGQFLVPNTGSSSRFRYVPLTDGAGNIQTLSLAGVRTLRLTTLEASQKNVIDVGDLQLNYLLFVPAATANTGPFIAYASPAAGTVAFDPEGIAQISIVNRGTSVNAGSIQLKFDGVSVTGNATISSTATGANISYKPGFLLPNSTHTLNVAFSDGTVSRTNQWSFTVFNMPLLLPSDRELTGPDSSFTVQVHKAQNAKTTASPVDSFNNNISRAERQLAGTLGDVDTPGMTFVNEADTNGGFNALTFIEPDAIHYEECGGSTPLFGQAKFYPGIAPPVWDCTANGSPDHFAIAATIKLSLAAGTYRMGFDADDEVAVQAGAPGTNYQGVALRLMLGNSETYPGHREPGNGHNPDAPFDTTFDFAVQTNGVYNFRLLHEEGTGGARVDWFWVNRTTGVRELVRPLALLSSPTVNGPYSVESAALINPSAKTVIVPKSGNTRFYRLASSTGYTLGRPIISGNNVVLNYQ